MQYVSSIKDAIIQGNLKDIQQLVKDALKDGLEVKAILNEGLISGMAVVGAKFKACEIYIPEVLISAKTMQLGIRVIEPHFKKSGIKPKGKITIGTVKGDLHDIGKNLVSMMLKGGGFEIIDLGIDVAPEKFIDSAIKNGSNIVAMSTLLTTSMPSMKHTIDLLKKKGLSGKVKTIIGGAAVTADYAKEINADGYAPDAATAVDRVKQLL